MADETITSPAPNPVRDEVERIKRLFAGGEGDREDLMTYARKIVSLRHHAECLMRAHRHGNGLQAWRDLEDKLERAIEESK